MTDQISAQMAEAHAPPAEDVGRVTIPQEVRDLSQRIRRASASVNSALCGLWSTDKAVETAREDLLRLAEDALAARRLMR